MDYVSFERHYFVLYNGVLTFELSKMALNPFCDEIIHLYINRVVNYARCFVCIQQEMRLDSETTFFFVEMHFHNVFIHIYYNNHM